LPDFRGLQGGHEHFESAGAIHFFANDLLHFAQNANAEWQESVQAAGEFPHEAGPEQKLMGTDFRIRWSLFQCGN
jgi:hypothetical protein